MLFPEEHKALASVDPEATPDERFGGFWNSVWNLGVAAEDAARAVALSDLHDRGGAEEMERPGAEEADAVARTAEAVERERRRERERLRSIRRRRNQTKEQREHERQRSQRRRQAMSAEQKTAHARAKHKLRKTMKQRKETLQAAEVLATVVAETQ